MSDAPVGLRRIWLWVGLPFALTIVVLNFASALRVAEPLKDGIVILGSVATVAALVIALRRVLLARRRASVRSRH